MRTVGRYGVVRELGRGGMGVVYLAWQGDLERYVALKELSAFHATDPMFARRFARESRFAGSLTHANLVTVFDYFEHDGVPYIAMEYVERGSLRPYIGGLSLAQIGGVLDGLLSGLEAASQRGIVHRDLKPENVMVSAEGLVKITDFGIAKATEGANTSVLLTQTGAAIGTPAYMAPEQATAGEVGPWTDLYALGCIAYELFTGKPPFHDAKTPMAALVKHVSEPLPPAAEVAPVDADLSDWIERLTAKAPEERWQSATDAREALEDLLVAKLGPVWRRQARLPAEPATPVPGPATPPPFEPSRPVAGIDLEGVGPDTPATEITPVRPPAPPPLARIGALALLAALIIPFLAPDLDRWNVFAVLSPFEAIGVAAIVWSTRKPAVHVACGALMTVAGIGLIKFTAERVNAVGVVLAVIVLGGGLAILVAGVRSAQPERTASPVDPGTLLFGLAGVALATIALFINYDGFSTLWSEVGEGESAEFFFEPFAIALAALTGLVVLGSWPRFAANLLLAVGIVASLHYLGVIVAAWRAIGEVGDVKAAGFVGLLGGVLIAAAGAAARRASK